MKDLDQGLEGRDLLVVEDIVDTGLTLNYLMNVLRARGPRTLKVAALLSKPSRRLVETPVDYTGFTHRGPLRRRLRPRLQREVPQPPRHRGLWRLTVPDVRYVLGIDAGGTKTVGLLADETGRVVGEARGDGRQPPDRRRARRSRRSSTAILETLVRATIPSRRSAWASRASTGPTTKASSAASCGASATARRARVVNDARDRAGGGRARSASASWCSRAPARSATAPTARRPHRARGRLRVPARRRGIRLLARAPVAARGGARARRPRARRRGCRAWSSRRWGSTSVAELIPRVYEKGLPKHRIAALAPPGRRRRTTRATRWRRT